jgi:hypothetical protein
MGLGVVTVRVEEGKIRRSLTWWGWPAGRIWRNQCTWHAPAGVVSQTRGHSSLQPCR